MKRITIISLILITASLVLSSCVGRTHDFTVLSSKNIDFNKNYKVSKSRTSGEFRVSIILIFPTGNVMSSDSFKEAVDRAIEATPGAVALTNVVVNYGGWYFLYGQQYVEVKGDAVVDVTAKVSDNGESYFFGEYDDNENLIDFKTIDKDNYIKLAE